MSRPPGVLRCIMLLAFCDAALRVFGFARTLRFARRISSHASPDIARDVVQPTLHNILIATAFYPGRSKCLEQAVASYILLRRRGVPVDLRMGVQPYPFFAHAWLELNGAPLTESPEVISRFALMPDPAL
jgi:hypothetical protein